MSEKEKRGFVDKLFFAAQVFSVAVLGVAAAVGATSVAGLAALDIVGTGALKKVLKEKKK